LSLKNNTIIKFVCGSWQKIGSGWYIEESKKKVLRTLN